MDVCYRMHNTIKTNKPIDKIKGMMAIISIWNMGQTKSFPMDLPTEVVFIPLSRLHQWYAADCNPKKDWLRKVSWRPIKEFLK